MAGIYGDNLLAFAEQYRDIVVYEMTAKMNAGWEIVENSQQTVLGVFQNTTPNTISNKNGNLVKSGGLELWSDAEALDGKYTTIGGAVYAIKGSNNWDHEGGFYRYQLEKVVGNNGTESDNTTFNTGSNSFG